MVNKEINEKKEDKVYEYFYSYEQLKKSAQSGNGQVAEFTPSGVVYKDSNARHTYIETPDGKKEYTECVLKGHYKNSVNKYGNKAFFECKESEAKRSFGEIISPALGLTAKRELRRRQPKLTLAKYRIRDKDAPVITQSKINIDWDKEMDID